MISILLAVLAAVSALVSRIGAGLLLVLGAVSLRWAKRTRKAAIACLSVATLFTGWSVISLLRPYGSVAERTDFGGSDRTVTLPLEVVQFPMDRVALVALAPNSDPEYTGFELQHLADGYGLIAYRADGYADIYDSPGMTSDPNERGQVIGKGLKHHMQTDLNATLTRNEFKAEFDTHDGRHVKINLISGDDQGVPVPILAPVGLSTKEPIFFPLFVLNDFTFMNTTGATIDISIDGVAMREEGSRFPLQSKMRNFVKYCTDGQFYQVFPARDQDVEHVQTTGDRYVDGQVVYVFSGDALARIDMGPHSITFDPPLDVTASGEGRVSMDIRPQGGSISGPYTLEAGHFSLTFDEVKLARQRDIGADAMIRALGFFQKWPKGYSFEADFTDGKVRSAWKNDN